MAVAALLLIAVAFFAVGQASALRGHAQTAADAAALAAARSERDGARDALLKALTSGDLNAIGALLTQRDGNGTGDDCAAADQYAGANQARVIGCDPVSGPSGYVVTVLSLGTVGDSPVQGTDSLHAKARATAVIQPRCTVRGKNGSSIEFSCDGGDWTVDPGDSDFRLNMSDFLNVHLSQ